MVSPAPAEDNRKNGYMLEINGEKSNVTVPVIVPLRQVAQALGFQVTWNNDGTITVDNGIMHTTITIGNDAYQFVTSDENLCGATAPLRLGVAPYVAGGAVYVPLEMFNALLGSNDAITLGEGKIVINTGSASENVEIPNPVTDVASLREAAETAGFSLEVPQVPDSVQLISNQLIQATYDNGMCIRKAVGDEDISGDYNSYARTETKDIAGISVMFRGREEGFYLATWTDREYTYSVSVSKAVSGAELAQLVSQVK